MVTYGLFVTEKFIKILGVFRMTLVLQWCRRGVTRVAFILTPIGKTVCEYEKRSIIGILSEFWGSWQMYDFSNKRKLCTALPAENALFAFVDDGVDEARAEADINWQIYHKYRRA